MPQIPVLKFQKYKLANGLQVILHEDHGTPIVGVNIWYHVGSKDERPGRTGFAHLFEHMMFQGSKHYDKIYFGPIQAAGGRLNGSTAMDRTNYWETVPSNYLELALWMESDRMGFLIPAMTQAKLDNQRDVVKNERRQSYDNRPYGLVHETILAALYPPDHPYSWPTIGSMKDLTEASREDIADFFRRYYHPANASLCIAGDFDPAVAKRLVEKYFGSIPAGPKVMHPEPRTPELKEEKLVHMTDRVGLARVYIVWPTPPHFTADDAALDVLGHVLAGGKTSRLYRRLVREKQIAQDVQAYQDGQELTGEFAIVATVRPGHTIAEVEAVMAEELARIKTEPPATDEIDRAVNTFEARLVRSLESISDFGGRADHLNLYNTYTGDPGYMAKDFGRYSCVDPAKVMQVARQFLGPGRVVVEVVPGNEISTKPNPLLLAEAARARMAHKLPSPIGKRSRGEGDNFPSPIGRGAGGEGVNLRTPNARGAGDEDAARESLPHGAAEPTFTLPPVRRSTLSNGMQLLVVEKHELPIINLNIVFPVGRANDAAQTPGLAEMTAVVWDEGTPTRTAEEIASQLGGMGSSISLAADWDTTSARLFSLKRHLPKTLAIFADILREPSFPESELHRQEIAVLGRLTQIRNEPTVLASLAATQLLYGYDHPYGHPPWGTPHVIKGLHPADLKRFYEGQIRPENAAVIAVGDIAIDELKQRLEESLGGWKSASPAPADPDFTVPPRRQTSLVLIDKPHAAQSVIQFALVGARRNTADFFPQNVMNMVFGGQFSSRLNMNLREQKGYTYGARSGWDWRVHERGPFVASASVQTVVTAQALAEFLKELDGVVGARPVEEKELDFCKKYITRGYTGSFETTSQVAAQLETLVAYRLPDDYFNTVVPGVRAVTADDTMRVAKKYLTLDRLSIVVVGDREKIEPELRKLPIGKDLTVFQFDDDFRLIHAAD